MDRLHVYRQSIELVKKTSHFLSQHRMPHLQIIANQLFRAALSVPLNISEGYGGSRKKWQNHLKIATGSANEVKTIYEVIEHTFDIDTSDLQEDAKYLGKRLTLLRLASS